MANASPTFRHQVFELPVLPLDITEYQVFHGHCQHCDAVSKGELPKTAPSGQMGPRLMSYISVLAGEYHLSIRKIQRLLRAQYGVTFSVGAISEAQGRISSILTPTHHALKRHIQKAKVIHADETSHQRNGESNTRWLWLMASSDAVFQNIRCFRSQDNAKHLLGEASHGVVVTDQCASYNWLDQRVTSFAWLMFNAICKRWRNTLAVDKRPTLVVGSCCYSRACSAPSIVTRLNSSLSHCGSGECSDYDEVSECS